MYVRHLEMEIEMPVPCYLMGSLELCLLPHGLFQKISGITEVPLLWDVGGKEMKLLMTTS